MLTAWWVAVGLLQTQGDAVRRAEVAQAVTAAQGFAQQARASAQDDRERRRFEQKFNRLVSAMEDFQREYNASAGRVWPKRQADALKKAIKELQLP